jgi:hypothetical protein
MGRRGIDSTGIVEGVEKTMGRKVNSNKVNNNEISMF